MILVLTSLFLASSLILASSEPVERIAFVSCFKEAKPSRGMESIANWEPQVFIWMGDNIYGDSEDMAVLREKYQVVKSNPDYARIRSQCEVVGTWDDHDYGANDAGKEFPQKQASQQEFLNFLDVPLDSPRRQQEGVYSRHDLGPEGKQVRIILLDTRYFRDPIGSDGTILGAAQWEWLETSLKESPAELNIVVSSIQVLAQDHRFEKWSNFPKERSRLLQLLARPDIPPVLILSGDRHLAEVSMDQSSCGYSLYDITSSSLNAGAGGRPDEKNRLRVGENVRTLNYGSLTIDWSTRVPHVLVAIHDQNGKSVVSLPIHLQEVK